MITLEIADEDVPLFVNVLNTYISGVEEAKEATIGDGSITTADDLLNLMSGYEDDLVVLNSIKERLQENASKI